MSLKLRLITRELISIDWCSFRLLDIPEVNSCKERMSFESIVAIATSRRSCSESFTRVQLKELLNQIGGIRVEALWPFIITAINDLFVHLHLVSVEEWRDASEHFIDHAAKCPQIHRKDRDVIIDHLRRLV